VTAPLHTKFKDMPETLAAFSQGGRAHIRKEIDEKYRRGLMEAARHAGATARFQIANALSNGPSSRGTAEAIEYFGAELDLKLKLTAGVVDGLEVSLPGFKKWLEFTGFGNDKTMIRGFVAWAEFVEGRPRVDSAIKQAAEGKQ
jgi:hypothetical protein